MNPVQDLLRQTRVLDLGPLPAPRLAPNVTVHQALQFLVRGRRGAIVIVEGLRPAGIFTERDVVYRFSKGVFTSSEQRRRTPISELMSPSPVTVRRQATLREAIDMMNRKQHRHQIVVDKDGELRGLLTTNDIVQYLTDQFPEDTVNLPPHLHQQYPSIEGA